MQKYKKNWCSQIIEQYFFAIHARLVLFFAYICREINVSQVIMNKIWVYICRDVDNLDVNQTLPLLSAQRKEQVLRFKPMKSRQLSAAAYLTLKKAMKDIYGIDKHLLFSYEEGGKPWLTDFPDIHFNLSHCQGVAVCAVGNVHVGVDAERVRKIGDSLIRYSMNEAECEQIFSKEPPVYEFMKLWTKKEAVLKLTGEGIRENLKTVLNKHENIFVTSDLIDDPDLMMSVALFSSNTDITVKHIDVNTLLADFIC